MLTAQNAGERRGRRALLYLDANTASCPGTARRAGQQRKDGQFAFLNVPGVAPAGDLAASGGFRSARAEVIDTEARGAARLAFGLVPLDRSRERWFACEQRRCPHLTDAPVNGAAGAGQRRPPEQTRMPSDLTPYAGGIRWLLPESLPEGTMRRRGAGGDGSRPGAVAPAGRLPRSAGATARDQEGLSAEGRVGREANRHPVLVVYGRARHVACATHGAVNCCTSPVTLAGDGPTRFNSPPCPIALARESAHRDDGPPKCGSDCTVARGSTAHASAIRTPARFRRIGEGAPSVGGRFRRQRLLLGDLVHFIDGAGAR
jgi:hypothetical protein